MPNVTVTVPEYPYDGVTSLLVEEETQFGPVTVLDTTVVGTFPDYVTEYTVPVHDVTNPLRAKWEIEPSIYTEWFDPSTVGIPATAPVVEALEQAMIQKATRILMLSKAPLGSWGELNEFGVATVRADHEIAELLYGLRFVNWDVDLPALVTTTTVIRVGLQTDPTTFPADRVADVQRAIDAAARWVASYILFGTNVA